VYVEVIYLKNKQYVSRKWEYYPNDRMMKEFKKTVEEMITTKTECLVCMRHDDHELIEGSQWGYEPPVEAKPDKPTKKAKNQTKLL
jgi:hypothetical protein